MSKKYEKEYKQELVDRCLSGETVTVAAKYAGIARSTLYEWINKNHEAKLCGKTKISLRTVLTLENKVKRLEVKIDILQNSGCTAQTQLREKLLAMEELQKTHGINILCEALQVPKGTFFNHILRNKRDNSWYSKRREKLKVKIQEVYDDSNQIFGAGKVTAVLRNMDYHVSVEMVRELMRDMGLVSIRQEAKDLYDKEQRKYKNYLNQIFYASQPNQVWVSDVTYFKCNGKGYYICVIIDLYARRVVGHKAGLANSTQLISSALKKACQLRNLIHGLIFHTDRGSNYQSKRFCDLLKSMNITKSVSRAHVPYDNSVMETFFSSMKREELYRRRYRSENEFLASVDSYIAFYNTVRPHAKINYRTPEQKEHEYYSKQAVFG
jgi:transposase InsO family protein/transposase-like protein